MSGHLEVICGPMYAGKSEQLIHRIKRAEIAGQRAVVFKPKIDNRYDENDVISHSGLKATAVAVKDSDDLYARCSYGNFNILAIDEVQFFDDKIFHIIKIFTGMGKRVIVTGLDMDFRQDPFTMMPDLLAIAKFVIKLRAVCQKCGEDAMYTQRLLNGNPAPLSGETVIVGGQEQYEARCENCWEAG